VAAVDTVAAVLLLLSWAAAVGMAAVVLPLDWGLAAYQEEGVVVARLPQAPLLLLLLLLVVVLLHQAGPALTANPGGDTVIPRSKAACGRAYQDGEVVVVVRGGGAVVASLFQKLLLLLVVVVVLWCCCWIREAQRVQQPVAVIAVIGDG